jgi:hypothetical protein
MTTGELVTLRDDVDAKVLRCERTGAPIRDLQPFQAAIDDELDRRGA